MKRLLTVLGLATLVLTGCASTSHKLPGSQVVVESNFGFIVPNVNVRVVDEEQNPKPFSIVYAFETEVIRTPEELEIMRKIGIGNGDEVMPKKVGHRQVLEGYIVKGGEFDIRVDSSYFEAWIYDMADSLYVEGAEIESLNPLVINKGRCIGYDWITLDELNDYRISFRDD